MDKILEIEKKVRKAISAMHRDSFFGGMVMNYHLCFTSRIPTVGISDNSKNHMVFWVNPVFIEELPSDMLNGLIKHELIHYLLNKNRF